MISFRQIRYFLAVAEAGNFSLAAAGLFVAQPALSRQVRALETELRETLLVRNDLFAPVEVELSLENVSNAVGDIFGNIVVA